MPDTDTSAQRDMCPRCQSFCMLGKQVPELEGEEWLHWEQMSSGKTGTTITSKQGLTASSQIGLVNFIKDVYNKGTKCNCGDKFEALTASISEAKEQYQDNNVSFLKNPSKYNSGFEKAKQKMHSSEAVGTTLSSGSLICANHYNYALWALTQRTGSTVNTDPGGDPITDNKDKSGGSISANPSKSNCAVAGYYDASVPQSAKKDQLITAQLYKDLCKYAKNLLYHPYQCDLCNIYEGGEWLEVTKEVFGAVKALNPLPVYFTQGGGFRTISANGMTMNTRMDCSGVVAACLRAFNPQKIPASAPAAWTTHFMGPDGSYGAAIKSAGFSWHAGHPPSGGWQEGDIQLNIQKHVQVVSENTALSYSGGSTSGLRGSLSGSGNMTYDGAWRGGIAGMSNGSASKEESCGEKEFDDKNYNSGECDTKEKDYGECKYGQTDSDNESSDNESSNNNNNTD